MIKSLRGPWPASNKPLSEHRIDQVKFSEDRVDCLCGKRMKVSEWTEHRGPLKSSH